MQLCNEISLDFNEEKGSPLTDDEVSVLDFYVVYYNGESES
jgi:hypothetical protein